MSKAQLNAIVKGISRNVDGLVFFTRDGNTYIRTYVKPKDPKSPGQQAVRSSFRTLAVDWKSIKGVVHASWKAYAKKKKIQAYSAFLGANTVFKRDGMPLIIARELGIPALEAFTAATGSAPGEVTIGFDQSSLAADKHVAVFVQKIQNGATMPGIVRKDLGTGINSGASITGFDAGVEYYLYAVITDAVYPQATRISESVAARVKAGG